MQVKLTEFSRCFGIDLVPDTMEEQALLIKFGMNATKEVKNLATTVHVDNKIFSWFVLGKRKQSVSVVKGGKK
jgi:hypothetical protein